MQSSIRGFGHYHDIISISYTILLTPLQRFLTFLFISQREREAMKDERTHHGSMGKSYSEQQTCVTVSIFYIVKNNCLYPPTSRGLTAGRKAGREAGQQTKYEWVSKF